MSKKTIKMNKAGKLAVSILIVLIVIVLTSAVMLLLVKTGVLDVKADNGQQVLNTEFIPYTREGRLAIQDFKFCGYVGSGYRCVGERNDFVLGDDVYFVFVVESSVYQGEVKLVENYRVKDAKGKVLFEIDNKNNYYFDAKSSKQTERVTFKDYFNIGDLVPGKYSLELWVDNPLINKRNKIVKDFAVEKIPEYNLTDEGRY